MDYKELWLKIITDLEPKVKKTGVLAWFGKTAILSYNNGILEIGLAKPIFLDWHQRNYQKLTFDAAKVYLPDIQKIQYTIDLALENNMSKVVDIQEHFGKKKPQQRKLRNKHAVKMECGVVSKILHPRYKLSNFVVGSNNRLAHAACLAVAANPGENYNPLFIYGGVGLGKTHLLQAIGNEVIMNRPNSIVAYITSEDFTNEVVDAIYKRKTEQLRNKYRKVDVLIIDDIQFIANKDRTQEEFFHTFNALYQAGKQIVISSDRPPAELDILEPRLRSRFAMGMLADVSEPDYETRLAILHSKAQGKDLFISNEVLEFIAQNIKSNIREVEGVLNQVLAQYDLEKATPTVKSVTKILKRMHIEPEQDVGFEEVKSEPNTSLTFDDILNTVCGYFHVPKEEVIGTSRLREYTLPRQIAMYLGKTKMKMALTKIGAVFHRDHTSVIHAVRKIEKEVKNNRQIMRDINSIQEEAGMI